MGIKKNFQKYKGFILNLLVPALVFGFITGAFTSTVVILYKLCASYVIDFSEVAYSFLRSHLYLLPAVAVALLGVGWLLAWIYKGSPNLKGGGIPTSVGVLRGLITFKWLRNLIGVFFLSLSSFLIGVPLGNEGPSVQMGTAIGRGSVYMFAKKHRAWDRYSMTGGACAGFSVATGAPISGILFAIEEAHQRISPTIVIVASSSVMFANITSKLLCPLVGVSERLFEIPAIPTLDITDYFIPLIVGLVVGMFSVLFLHYYRFLDFVLDRVFSKIPHFVKIFMVLVLTVTFGLVSTSFVSTGHHLILDLFVNNTSVWLLLGILAVRMTLTLSANSTGVTGGTFIPILAIGVLVSSIIANCLLALGVDSSLYTVILVLGITACIAGSMKMPLTAIIFSVEALSCYDNLLPVIITAFIAYLVTELFGAKSISDATIEMREEYEEKGKAVTTVDTFVTVQRGAFAIGKQIRDIFWPRNLFVLSLQHISSETEVDEHGGKEIREGDILHIRYSTTENDTTKGELLAIVGEQDINEECEQ